MAASKGPTGQIQNHVYVSLTATAAVDTWANLTKASTGLVIAGNLLKGCVGFTGLEQRGNTAEWTPLGEGTTRTIAAAAGLSEVQIEIVIEEDNTLHAALAKASTGDSIAAAVVKKTGDSAQTAYFVRGTISSGGQAFDTPNQMTLGIALAAKPVRLDQS